jgi:heat shock protein HslJ
MKTTIYILIAIAVLVGGFYAFNNYIYNEKQGDPVVKEMVTDPKNATYKVNGEAVTLKDGVSEVAIPDSSAKVVTRYFGNELKTDLNGDGREDTFFLLTQETGGSGTFYYAAGALNTPDGYVGTQATLIGDRIAPQSTNKGTGSIVVVNYAVRKPGEAFTVSPSVGKSIWLKLDPAALQFGEVVQNFEGEANPAVMKLDMNKWNWISTTDKAGTNTVPKKAGVFTLTFKKDGSFSASTDCNGIGGSYVVNGSKITFSKMMSTLMYCEESQENLYKSIFEGATSFEFTTKGELVFTLKDGGKAVFR